MSDVVEDGAPNGGDGNGDSIPDSEQANVTSLPSAMDESYVTLASPEGTMLVDVEVLDPETFVTPPEEVSGLPLGVLSFTVAGVTPGATVVVEIFTEAPIAMSSYYKFGSEPGEIADHWYEFLYDGTSGAVLGTQTITLILVDGGRGDDDLVADGTIVDPGGPSLLANLDIDGDGEAMPLTDGLLFVRSRFGFTGGPLIAGAVGPDCTRCTAAEIEAYLSGLSSLLDVDADGNVESLTDGLMVLRFLFGFSGATLVNGAVSPECARCGADEVVPYLTSLVP